MNAQQIDKMRSRGLITYKEAYTKAIIALVETEQEIQVLEAKIKLLQILLGDDTVASLVKETWK